jgi:hypothetical protein
MGAHPAAQGVPRGTDRRAGTRRDAPAGTASEASAPSNSERGTKFEKLMVRYFDLDPLLSQQYDGVW